MNSHLRSNRIKTRSPQSEFQLSIEPQMQQGKRQGKGEWVGGSLHSLKGSPRDIQHGKAPL